MSETMRLRDLLARHTHAGADELVRAEGDALRCLACGHRCRIKEGRAGVCRVRFREKGGIRVPWGYVAGLQVDPIEKKPFYHAYPGRDALSFGMLGCDLHCSFCQNWISSQVLRDEHAVAHPTPIDAPDLARLAVRHRAPVVVSTYNEPLITSDWAVEIFRHAKEQGLVCGYVSNGNATPEVIAYLRPWVDLFKVDLKGFDDRRYRKLGGVLKTVLDTIEALVADGFWVEVVTLVVPGFNDGAEELRSIAEFLAGVSVDLPWHVTAFHPDYRMDGPEQRRTPPSTLARAHDLGKEAGLRHVYAGNLPGGVGEMENTRCPGCGATLITRVGFRVTANRMRGDRCPDCETTIAGRWEARPPRRETGPGIPRRVR
jgi:pyruvate formate lyase activating enzyme